MSHSNLLGVIVPVKAKCIGLALKIVNDGKGEDVVGVEKVVVGAKKSASVCFGGSVLTLRLTRDVMDHVSDIVC